MKFLALLSLIALTSAAPTREILKRDSTTCGSTYYSADAVSAAANAACQYVQNGEDAGSSDYPHQYKDYEGFSFDGLSGPFYEFPILSSGEVYSGGSPGADRVIVDNNCDIAGVITHQGASGESFVACSGTD